MSLVFKLFETAGRDTTPLNERLIAMDKLYAMSVKSGGIDKLFPSVAAQPQPQTYIAYAQQRREIVRMEAVISGLEKQLENRDADIERYRKIISEKDREIQKLQQRAGASKISSTVMTYRDFAREVRARLVNADRNWQMMFEEQTGLKRSKFARFCQIGQVDSAEFIRALDKLTPCPPPAERNGHWTVEEVQRIRSLHEQGETEKNIAQILTKELGRRVTDNMIKRLKHNSRHGIGVFRDPKYGAPIGETRK